MLDKLLGKHVTIIAPQTNQPISPDAAMTLFSGVLQDYNQEILQITLYDGTQGLFFRKWIIGIIENKTVDQEDPEAKLVDKV